MEMVDINGIEIKKGCIVNVPAPLEEDQWNFDFQGSVIEIQDDYVIVEDGEGDCWCVEPERLEIEP